MRASQKTSFGDTRYDGAGAARSYCHGIRPPLRTEAVIAGEISERISVSGKGAPAAYATFRFGPRTSTEAGVR
jgi:hypothetical protein